MNYVHGLEQDIIFDDPYNDDAMADWYGIVKSSVKVLTWTPIYTGKEDFFDFFSSCEGPHCLQYPEYYVKLFNSVSEEVFNTRKKSLLTVGPNTESFELRDFLEETRKRIEEESKKSRRELRNECLNTEGTVKHECVILFSEEANVKPLSVTLKDAGDNIGDWFLKDHELWTKGEFVVFGFGCASCSRSPLELPITVLFSPTTLEDISDGEITDEDFRYPQALLFSKESCTLCIEGANKMLNNNQLFVVSFYPLISKSFLQVGVRVTAKKLGKKSAKVILDDTGLGARLIYKEADDIFYADFVYQNSDDVISKVALSKNIYKNPIYSFVGGEEFIFFNIAEEGVIAQISGLSGKSKKYLANHLFAKGYFQEYYANIKKIIPEIKDVKIIFKEDYAVPYGYYRFDGKNADDIAEIVIDINFPYNFDGSGIPKWKTVLSILEHESGHLGQHQGLLRKGIAIKNYDRMNYALEHANDLQMLEFTKSKEAYTNTIKNKMLGIDKKGKLSDSIEESAKQIFIRYKNAKRSGQPVDHELASFYNMAKKIKYTSAELAVQKQFDKYYPAGWDLFTKETNDLAEAIAILNKEVTTSSHKPTTAFKNVVRDYKLDYWPTETINGALIFTTGKVQTEENNTTSDNGFVPPLPPEECLDYYCVSPDGSMSIQYRPVTKEEYEKEGNLCKSVPCGTDPYEQNIKEKKYGCDCDSSDEAPSLYAIIFPLLAIGLLLFRSKGQRS